MDGNPMAAGGTPAPIDILLFTKSPAGVYVGARDFIVENIASKCSDMEKVWRDLDATIKSQTAKLLMYSVAFRESEANIAQQKVWKDFVRLRVKQSNGKATEEDNKSDFAKNMKDMELRPIVEADIGPKFKVCNDMTLCSMLGFQFNADKWSNPSILKIKLPEPYEDALKALGVEQLAENAKELSHTNLTLARLLRAFRGTFVISPGEHAERFISCLIRIDSLFMDNVILKKGIGKKGVIPVTAVYVFDTEAKGEAPKKVTAYNAKTCDIFLEMPLEFVLNTMQDMLAELKEIINESGDDVL